MTKMPTLPDDFQKAADAAQARWGEVTWATMTVAEQATAIYAELQKIDTARTKALPKTRRERKSPSKSP
jgi:ABC-type branched-subunit amino acid transport system substrate-binding protein